MAYEPLHYNGWVIIKRTDWDAMQTKRIKLAQETIQQDVEIQHNQNLCRILQNSDMAPHIGNAEETMRYGREQDVVEYADTFIQPYTFVREEL